MTPRAWAIRHLICLVTLIINIYGLGWGSRSHFFYTDSPAGWGWALGIKNAECTTSHWHLHPFQIYFLMVEIPTPKPYIFMIRVNRQIKCPKSWDPGSSPYPTGSFTSEMCIVSRFFNLNVCPHLKKAWCSTQVFHNRFAILWLSIKFLFLWVSRFPPPIKLTATI
jgi:hypothetical protein